MDMLRNVGIVKVGRSVSLQAKSWGSHASLNGRFTTACLHALTELFRQTFYPKPLLRWHGSCLVEVNKNIAVNSTVTPSFRVRICFVKF